VGLLSIGLALAVLAILIAVVLVLVRLVRGRTAQDSQRVRAEAHAGPPAVVSVHDTGDGPVRTVRIETHLDRGSLTVEERES